MVAGIGEQAKATIVLANSWFPGQDSDLDFRTWEVGVLPLDDQG
jgi:hypothetical protein